MSGHDYVRWLPDRVGLAEPGVRQVSVIDPLLTATLLLIIGYGLLVLFSAIERDLDVLRAQSLRMGLGLLVMIVAAYVSPRLYLRWAPLLYCAGLLMLVAVLFFGFNKMEISEAEPEVEPGE